MLEFFVVAREVLQSTGKWLEHNGEVDGRGGEVPIVVLDRSRAIIFCVVDSNGLRCSHKKRCITPAAHNKACVEESSTLYKQAILSLACL